MKKLLFALILIMFSIPAWGANYFPNGSFEVGIFGWGYNSTEVPNSLSSQWTTSQYHTGAYSLKLLNHYDPSTFWIESKPIKLKRSQAYTLSFWHKKDAGWDHGNSNMRWDVRSYDQYNSAYNMEDVYFEQNVTNWTQDHFTFTTSASHDWYTFRFNNNNQLAANNITYIDDILLEEGDVTPGDPWSPMYNIEVGVTTAKTSNVFLQTDTVTLTLLSRNDSGANRTVTVNYEIYNGWNTKVLNGSSSRTIADTTTDTWTLTPTLGVGHYRIYAWVSGEEYSQTETVFAVVPTPQNTATIDADSIIGIHSKDYSSYMGVLANMGVKWNRQFWSNNAWNSFEPTQGTHSAVDITADNDNKIIPFMLVGYQTDKLPLWGCATKSTNPVTEGCNNTGDVVFTRNTAPTKDTIALTGHTLTDKFSINDQIIVQRYPYDPDNPGANDGIYTLSAVTDTTLTLTVSATLTGETQSYYIIINYTHYKEYVSALIDHYYTQQASDDKVIYWGIWNEPGHGAGVIPATYATILQDTSTLIKATVTGAKVVGYGGEQPSDMSADEWVKKVWDIRGKNDIDYFETHAYPSINQLYTGGTDGYGKDAHDSVGEVYSINVWNSETGNDDIPSYLSYPIGIYRKSSSGTEWYARNYHYPDRGSQALVTNFFLTIGDWGGTYKNNKYFYYDGRTGQGFTEDINAVSIWNQDGSPRQKAISYSVIAKFFDKPTSIGTYLDTAPTDVWAYSWVDKDSYAWVVIWCKDANGLERVLKTVATHNNYAYYDIYGTQQSASTASFPIGPTPIYIKALATTATFTEATMITDFTTADHYSARTDSVAPILMITSAPRGQLTSGENIYIGFHAIDPDSPCDDSEAGHSENIQYSWMLSGVDSSFTSYSSSPYVTYSSVSAGDYTFTVRAKDETGNVREVILRNGEIVTGNLIGGVITGGSIK